MKNCMTSSFIDKRSLFRLRPLWWDWVKVWLLYKIHIVSLSLEIQQLLLQGCQGRWRWNWGDRRLVINWNVIDRIGRLLQALRHYKVSLWIFWDALCLVRYEIHYYRVISLVSAHLIFGVLLTLVLCGNHWPSKLIFVILMIMLCTRSLKILSSLLVIPLAYHGHQLLRLLALTLYSDLLLLLHHHPLTICLLFHY